MQESQANLYDYPKYYDLVYGSDWKAEFDFLREVFARHAKREVRRVFEPACGTGRLLDKLAAASFEVSGNDLNARAVAFCNARLARRGFAPTVKVGDMADFRLPRRVDAAFNMINSFRHLTSQRQARQHLQCVADALARGGVYVLGLHLTPLVGEPTKRESWSARRGNLAVVSHLWSEDVDLTKRRETFGMAMDVYTPRRQFRLTDRLEFRTYTARQMAALFAQLEKMEVAATYDFSYDVNCPIKVAPETEDVVYVLRKV
ncbi:MAG: class I SAM-dependent methyltransferase [Pirellulales bacterium]